MDEARIEDWAIVKYPNKYRSPEKEEVCLLGYVYDHPKHENGKFVHTSTVMHSDGNEVITMNTKYQLGKVSENYKFWYYLTQKKELNEKAPFST